MQIRQEKAGQAQRGTRVACSTYSFQAFKQQTQLVCVGSSGSPRYLPSQLARKPQQDSGSPRHAAGSHDTHGGRVSRGMRRAASPGGREAPGAGRLHTQRQSAHHCAPPAFCVAGNRWRRRSGAAAREPHGRRPQATHSATELGLRGFAQCCPSAARRHGGRTHAQRMHSAARQAPPLQPPP